MEGCPLTIIINTMLQTQNNWTCIDNSILVPMQSSSMACLNAMESTILHAMVNLVYRLMVTIPAT